MTFPPSSEKFSGEGYPLWSDFHNIVITSVGFQAYFIPTKHLLSFKIIYI